MKGDKGRYAQIDRYRKGFDNTKANSRCATCALKLVPGNKRSRWCDKYVYMEITCVGLDDVI